LRSPLLTITLAVPAFEIKSAVIAAVSWVGLTKVAARVAPFQVTADVGR